MDKDFPYLNSNLDLIASLLEILNPRENINKNFVLNIQIIVVTDTVLFNTESQRIITFFLYS